MTYIIHFYTTRPLQSTMSSCVWSWPYNLACHSTQEVLADCNSEIVFHDPLIFAHSHWFSAQWSPERWQAIEQGLQSPSSTGNCLSLAKGCYDTQRRGPKLLVEIAFHKCKLNHCWIKNNPEKNPESFKKWNLNLPYTGNYLHSIYIVFTAIYIFTFPDSPVGKGDP